MSIFESLIDQRKKQKVTQKEMSLYLKITPASLNRYEKLNRKITSELIDQYAEYLGFEIRLLKK